MNYNEDIRIDETALDVEWLCQPELMMRYTRHSARMRQDLDKAKQDLDIAKSEADRDIRKNPDRYGFEKITESAVANAVLIHSKYKEAYSAYLEAKFEADMAQGAVNAFEQRKSALENLVRLYTSQYFAGPIIPRDLATERAIKDRSASEKIATARTRKRNEE